MSVSCAGCGNVFSCMYPDCESGRQVGSRAAVSQSGFEGEIIDLNAEFFKSLCEAAERSTWIPRQHYFTNDWVSDCVKFLETGEGIALAKPVHFPYVCVAAKMLAGAAGMFFLLACIYVLPDLVVG